jgi:NAD(P)-dependent dehydrogenase (short-subunit alcohol dehydrogenase family)
MGFCSGIVAAVAIIIGLLLSPVPTHLGFYRWLATRNPANRKRNHANPMLVGISPAANYDIPWGYTFEQLHQHNLTGQNALVTGANSGLGYEVSLALAKLGASVVMACRNEARCLKAAQDIRQHEDVKGQVFPMKVELSSLQSVKSFAESYLMQIGPLDMLFLNAGISQTPVGAALLSEDGIELVFATNVVGHHLLYKMLEPKLAESQMARVVLTSSGASFDTFNYSVATDLDTLNGEEVKFQTSNKLYGQSKLAQIMWAKKLTRILGPDANIFVNSAHPGAVATPIFSKRNNPVIIQKDWLNTTMWLAEVAALNLLYLGVATDELGGKNIRGKYYHPMAVEMVNPLSLDEKLQDDLWRFLDDLVEDFV